MHERASAWFHKRSSNWKEWPLDRLLELKFRQDSRISLVIPARDEAATISEIVGTLRTALVKDAPLLDELVVIDSNSSDATATLAEQAGATVYRAGDIAPEQGNHHGKGEALWKSLFVTSGDLLVFVDADLTGWGPHFVTGLLGPLLTDPGTLLVRAAYTRLRTGSDGTTSPDGGRVTELVARPLLSLYWPELTGVVQPLAGEWAARRSLMESLSIPVGYGVELSTLVDTASGYGLDAIAQVHLGARAHRHRSDHDLALTAAEVLAVAESRRDRPGAALTAPQLQQFRQDGDWVTPQARPVPVSERPPAVGIARAEDGKPE
ncbi:glucosyl-3-phosphoglycerate synthase [Planosporangium mesophilum]|uniref:Glucosyl-3-phosphoglycerate synthase n=1 Tax=Planosporangium mesophilum TaxID=689768 RepID=A0A8J3TE42_9ACTN|nr:glucosyl-3-phosphoglycerate synthase [Planosporangium mesophilum]NJC86428.1 glucosyl-3-phosphoglycerate synthase [Planosporangium mesophilum]GII25133.1 glucosyl-3-phosphoglycerate synthase [Planosporangium mesophilum]